MKDPSKKTSQKWLQEHQERINPRHNVWTSDGSGTQNMDFGSDMEKMGVGI